MRIIIITQYIIIIMYMHYKHVIVNASVALQHSIASIQVHTVSIRVSVVYSLPQQVMSQLSYQYCPYYDRYKQYSPLKDAAVPLVHREFTKEAKAEMVSK